MTKTMEVNSQLKIGSGLRATFVSFLGVLLLLSLGGIEAFAQDGTEGIDQGAYRYQGSFDLGYRFVNTLGARSVYDTLVDEREGPRLLDQTLNVRSLEHRGLLFDNLFVTSFGWGGDPENSGRVRMSKDRWYDFNATFRRDHNYFDYNSLANPLNPSNQYVQVNNSPHGTATVRRSTTTI